MAIERQRPPAGTDPPRSEVGYTQDDLREALAHVPTPVTVITTLDGHHPHGTTVSAVASLSADPPLLLVALDRNSNLLSRLRLTGQFGVNVLSKGQEEIAVRCAGKAADKFDAVRWQEVGGVPRIVGAASWFLCEVESLLPGGDHEIVVGHITECANEAHEPLIYHRRAFTLPGGSHR